MSLHDLANRAGPPAHTCTVCWIATQLEPADAAALQAAIANPAVRHTEVRDELTALGYDVTTGTISRHATGGCRR